ncbi:response regulator [Paenibacillus sp. GCM10023252]|uniref:response regulator n=1 Tax=Paenibacillus sp. GCM10023252 TaxID=3252649 RepID=UPI00361DEF78
MYKVLIVDDEVLDLEGMKDLIPWPAFGMEVEAAVISGFEALEYIQHHTIDVLVTDIKMPIMSGIELAGRALELQPGLKLVFVSGYEDFQYAKHAIKLNASGYILKPVDDPEIEAVLQEVRAALDREAELLKLERRVKDSHYSSTEERLHAWLSGELEAEAVAALIQELNLALNPALNQASDPVLDQPVNPSLNLAPNPVLNQPVNPSLNLAPNSAVNSALNPALHPTPNPALNPAQVSDGSRGPYQTALIELDDISLKLERQSAEEKHGVIRQSSQLLMDVCRAEGLSLLCKSDKHRLAVIVSGKEEQDKLPLILSHMEKHAPLTVTIALGGASHLLEDMPHSYEEAADLLTYKMFCGKNRILTAADSIPYQRQDVIDIDDMLQTMFVAMVNYDLVKVDDGLQQLYEQVRSLGKRMTVYNVTLHLLSKLDSYLFSMNENLKSILGMEINQLDMLYHFETVHDIQSWLRRKLFEISELLQLKKLRKNRKLVEEVEAYVLLHLNTNLTLRDVANHFSFSPNYLGHLFKEEKEENFSDYVIRKRMERAATLLQDPKLKIYEVADLVGYNSLTYFSRQFREKFGTTPGDYRKKS